MILSFFGPEMISGHYLKNIDDDPIGHTLRPIFVPITKKVKSWTFLLQQFFGREKTQLEYKYEHGNACCVILIATIDKNVMVSINVIIMKNLEYP